jgi:hypothetical protein
LRAGQVVGELGNIALLVAGNEDGQSHEFLSGDGAAEDRICGVEGRRRGGDGDCLLLIADLQDGIESEDLVFIEDDALLPCGFESGGRDGDGVGADDERTDLVRSCRGRVARGVDTGCIVGGCNDSRRNYGAGWIGDGSGDCGVARSLRRCRYGC